MRQNVKLLKEALRDQYLADSQARGIDNNQQIKDMAMERAHAEEVRSFWPSIV